MVKTLLVSFVLSVGLLVFAGAASAQGVESSGKKLSVGGELGFVIPTGDWSDFTSVGFGFHGRLDFSLAPKVAVTGMIGYIFHLSKEQDLGGLGTVDTSTAELNFLGGARFYPVPKVDLHLLTGIASVAGKIEDESESETRIPLLVGGAYEVAPGIEVGADLYLPNFLLTEDGEDTFLGFMLKGSYMFDM